MLCCIVVAGWWFYVVFIKQKTAYEMRISDWSSDVCSSDLVEIPNRVVRTAHSTHFGSGGIVPSLIDYHVERARGGVGLTILEIAGVHPTCPSSICNFDDSVIEGYEQLMRAKIGRAHV